MSKLLKSAPVLVICLFVAIMLFPNLETLQVSIMEARNYVTAREMVTHDHWLLTTLNNVARYQKPPLPAWCSALSSYIFGLNSLFGMRLPAVLMVMLSGSFMFFLSETILKNRAHSMFNALILLTSFYVIGIVFEAPSDIFTHAFMLVSIYYLYKLFEVDQKRWKHAILGGIFLGLSILSKGPISIYALFLPFLIAYGFSFKYKNLTLKWPHILSTILLGIMIGGSWYLYVKLQDSSTLDTIASKEAGTWTSYRTRPFYHYWSFVIQSGIWTIPAFISLLYPYLKKRASNPKAYKFSLIWVITAVVLLSLIPMKKHRYLMPVLIPLAFNIGFYIEYLIRRFKTLTDKRETLPVYFNFSLIGLAGIAFPIVMLVMFKGKLQDHLFSFVLASVAMVAIGVSILLQLKAKEIKNVFLLTVGLFASFFVFGLPLSKVLANDAYNSPISLREEIKTLGINLYAIDILSPELIWDYDGIIPQIERKNDRYQFPIDEKFGILVNTMTSEEEAEIRSTYDMRVIENYNLNQLGSSSKRRRSRLRFIFYILEKK